MTTQDDVVTNGAGRKLSYLDKATGPGSQGSASWPVPGDRSALAAAGVTRPQESGVRVHTQPRRRVALGPDNPTPPVLERTVMSLPQDVYTALQLSLGHFWKYKKA